MTEIIDNSRKKKETNISIEDVISNKKISKNEKTFSFSTNNIIDNKESILQTNILINSLKEFHMEEKKIISRKKFVISFKELIDLLIGAISVQKKIDNMIYVNKNNKFIVQKINQTYMNDFGNKIFSFDKVDGEGNMDSKQAKIFTINKSSKNLKLKIKKLFNNSQIFVSPTHGKNNTNPVFEKIYKDIFVVGNNNTLNGSNKRNIKANKKNELLKSKNIYNNQKNKSVKLIKSKKSVSPPICDIDQKSINKNKKKKLNNSIITNNICNNISYNNSNTNLNSKFNFSNDKNIKNKHKNNTRSSIDKKNPKNKSVLKKSNTIKNIKIKKVKDSVKSSDIFWACKNIDMIKKSANKKTLSKANFNYDLIDSNSFLQKSLKNVGLKEIYNGSNIKEFFGDDDLKFYRGIKKVIVSNAHKPFNLAKKLLLSGQKYIDDFKEMNETSKNKKKKF